MLAQNFETVNDRYIRYSSLNSGCRPKKRIRSMSFTMDGDYPEDEFEMYRKMLKLCIETQEPEIVTPFSMEICNSEPEIIEEEEFPTNNTGLSIKFKEEYSFLSDHINREVKSMFLNEKYPILPDDSFPMQNPYISADSFNNPSVDLLLYKPPETLPVTQTEVESRYSSEDEYTEYIDLDE